MILRVLTQRIEGKAKDYISGSQFGFRRGVGIRNAIGTMGMLIQRSLEYNNKMYVCSVDFEKAFDRVSWTIMMAILKTIGADWRDRRLIAELYYRQEMIVRTDGQESEPCIVGRGVRQGCLVSPLLFSLYAEFMMMEAMEEVEEGIKVGGKLLKNIRFAGDQGMLEIRNDAYRK